MEWHQEKSDLLLNRKDVHPSVPGAAAGYKGGAGCFTFLYFHLPFFGHGDNQAVPLPEVSQGERFVVCRRGNNNIDKSPTEMGKNHLVVAHPLGLPTLLPP